MSEVWFTADSHFGHRSMVEKGWRPQFSTVAEMDEFMIDRWNSTVHPKDVVWHLGDFGLGGMMHFLPIVKKLHGAIHLIPGNHDQVWPGNRDSHKYQSAWMEAGFVSIQAFARRRINGQSVLLSHFPYCGDHVETDRFDDFRLRDNGLWLLHGHVHSEWRTRGRMINVGVDVNDFAPVHLADVAVTMFRAANAAVQDSGVVTG